ncbi:MAG: hypothetical protein HOV79_09260 [Hamadaea sp.]|nr:hypothetical protein [Hamadaea sp.]
MFARSTTIIVDHASIDRAVTLMRDEVMPALLRIDGCIGMSVLVDRESGRCIATSSWRSSEAMRASNAQVAPLRDQVIATLRAKEPLIQEWEIPVMHRSHPAPEGAGARLSWLKGDPANLESATESYKMIMPLLDDLTGFCSASLLINRDTGQAVSTVVYDNAEALMRTREVANSLRGRVAEQAGAEVLEVAEFELALAHLRVPELV